MADNTLTSAFEAGRQSEQHEPTSDRSVLASLFAELHHDLGITRRIVLIGFLAGLAVLAAWGVVEREKYVLAVRGCSVAPFGFNQGTRD
jgi:hypothetical protein